MLYLALIALLSLGLADRRCAIPAVAIAVVLGVLYIVADPQRL